MPYTPGPFDSAHWVLQWGGKLPGSETWSCSLRMALTGGAVTITSTEHAAVVAAIQAYHQAANTQISSLAKLSFVKFNPVDVNGHYSFDTTNETIVADVAGGVTETTPKYPNQVTWVVSTVTGFSRGPAHAGRFFNPLPTVTVQADGLVGASAATNLKTTGNTLITSLNAVAAGLKVAVFSRKSGAATHRLVTGVEVGRALDTQRRRRRKLTELHV